MTCKDGEIEKIGTNLEKPHFQVKNVPRKLLANNVHLGLAERQILSIFQCRSNELKIFHSGGVTHAGVRAPELRRNGVF